MERIYFEEIGFFGVNGIFHNWGKKNGFMVQVY
jgi:hypothetical protein